MSQLHLTQERRRRRTPAALLVAASAVSPWLSGCGTIEKVDPAASCQGRDCLHPPAPVDRDDPATALELFTLDTSSIRGRDMAIVETLGGKLLAFMTQQPANNDPARLVFKWSTDSGAAWSEVNLIDTSPANDPRYAAAVVDRSSGHIVLVFADCRLREGDMDPTCDDLMAVTSEDEGASWSPPRSIRDEVAEADWIEVRPDAGHATQLYRGASAGRLVFTASFEQPAPSFHRHLFLIVSDDGGSTFSRGAVHAMAPEQADWFTWPPATLVELVDQRLLVGIHVVDGSGVGRGRVHLHSSDAGQSFDPGWRYDDAFQPEIGEQASMIRYSAIDHGSSANRLLFACPNELWSSTDEGNTWSQHSLVLPVEEQRAVDLVLSRDSTIGALVLRNWFGSVDYVRFGIGALD